MFGANRAEIGRKSMIFFPRQTDHKYQNIIIMYGKYFLRHYLEKEIVDTQLG